MTFQCLAFHDLSVQQLYNIMKLRQEVFVVEQDCAYLDADGRDEESFHLVSWNEEGEAVAYLRLLPKGMTYPDYTSIGRVVTAEKVRGTGAGKLLMEEALVWAKKLFDDAPLKISAQSYLINFYSELGFEVVTEEYLEDGIPHVGMKLK
jgi:ElaA protein